MTSLRVALGALVVQLALWSPAARAATTDGAAASATKAKKPPVAPKRHPGKVTRASKPHVKSARWARRDDGHLAPGMINESISLTPFPSEAAPTRRALAQNRRDMLDDAEKTARASTANDRWQTVLFDLREIDSRSDPEGCFWRLVAYYRLGQIQRARQIRSSCDLPPRDVALLEAEDAEAAALQPPLALAEIDHPPPPVANPAPYSGAAPTRFER